MITEFEAKTALCRMWFNISVQLNKMFAFLKKPKFEQHTYIFKSFSYWCFLRRRKSHHFLHIYAYIEWVSVCACVLVHIFTHIHVLIHINNGYITWEMLRSLTNLSRYEEQQSIQWIFEIECKISRTQYWTIYIYIDGYTDIHQLTEHYTQM